MLDQRVYGLVYDYVGSWNRHDTDDLAALYSDDALYEDLRSAATLHGRTAIRAHLRELFTAWSDAALTLGAQPVAAGDRAYFEWLMVGDRDGQAQELRGVSVMLVEDGCIVRQTDYPHPAGGAGGSSASGSAASIDMKNAGAPIEDNIAWGE